MKNEQKQEKKQVKKIQNSKKAESQVATKENKKINKGITLIALVITIVVLIILAGISINLVLGENGIFTKAQNAAKDMDMASLKEQISTELLSMQIENEENNFAVEESDVEKILSKYGKIIRSEDGKIIGLKPTGKDYEIPFVELWQGETINSYNETKHVNAPKIAGTGLTPVKISDNGAITKTTEDDTEWYNYEEKQWANAQSADGSLWVWIPRYAYKIKYENNDDYSQGGTIDVKFLIGTTDNYEETNTEIGASEEQVQEAGNQKTAKRATLDNMKEGGTPVDTTSDYYVHPAFTDESSIGYANGGWDRELTGIWVAKFEAGYTGEANKEPSSQLDKVKDTKIKYINTTGKISTTEENSNKYYYGTRNENTTMTYPTFQANKASYNCISVGDMFTLCRSLTQIGNPYNLSNKVDSHLIKNSEWGAVSYLAWSSYGQTGSKIRINNVSVNGTDATGTIYAVTGYGAEKEGAAVNTSLALTDLLNGTVDGNWKTTNGKLASTTGNITGIYDMSGATWERTSSFINNGNISLVTYAESLLKEAGIEIKDENGNKKPIVDTGNSTKYVTIYPHDKNYDNDSTIESEYNTASQKNFANNTKIFGDAYRETTGAKAGSSVSNFDAQGWNYAWSKFPRCLQPVFMRGAVYSDSGHATNLGVGPSKGLPDYGQAFRAVLIP